MFEVQLLIPFTDNQGVTFDAPAHAAFEQFVMDRFGGISRWPGEVTGSWQDQRQVYRDATRCYVVAVRTIRHGNLIGEVVDFAKAHYEQEAIYIRYLGLSEIL
jgi:hypothetical protein